MKHFLTIADFDKEWVLKTLDKAIDIKTHPDKYKGALNNKTLAMLFMKTSTRTRCSFETGMTQLGGHAMFLDWRTTNFTLGKSEDEIGCLARYADIIMARVNKNEEITAMANSSRVPVINALCNKYHPCQAMADLLTIKEKLGTLENKKLAFIGDGNNVCNSLIIACTKVGMKISIAIPEGYEPDKEIMERAKLTGLFELTHSPSQAVQNADVVYTDTWVSMGEEEKAKQKMQAFQDFQVNLDLLRTHNAENAIIMHCLPAHRGYEISDDAMDSKNSVVFDQAENRLHAQKAIMLRLLFN